MRFQKSPYYVPADEISARRIQGVVSPLALHRRMISEIQMVLDQTPKGHTTFGRDTCVYAVLVEFLHTFLLFR